MTPFDYKVMVDGVRVSLDKDTPVNLLYVLAMISMGTEKLYHAKLNEVAKDKQEQEVSESV